MIYNILALLDAFLESLEMYNYLQINSIFS